MDKVEKFLRKLDPNDLARITPILKQIAQGKVEKLDIKKLKGKTGAFRVRVGEIRIVFVKEDAITRIIFIDRRSEDTYKNL